MDVRAYNRQAWDHQASHGNRWTVPVTTDQVQAARCGEWEVLLTPTLPVPRDWFPQDMRGKRLLGLACGGGQQGPIFAAAGAKVTIYDNSPVQLSNDQQVADRDGLKLELMEGDMADLSALADNTFDIIFHPVSNVFVPSVQPVWQEAFRVLRPGGTLLAGFMNPLLYIFDIELMDREKRFEVRYSIPYSDIESLSPQDRQRYQDQGIPLEFGHSLDDLIGGQLRAGFHLNGFFEDKDPEVLLCQYIPVYIATRAIKP